MENIIQSPIPTQVVIAEKRNDIAHDLRQAVSKLQQAFQEVRGIAQIESLGAVPPLQALTPSWVANIIGERQEAIRKSPLLTPEQKSSANKHWGRVATRLNNAISHIHGLAQKYPGLAITFDYHTNNYTIEQIDEYATSAATLQVPDEANAHYALICDVAAAIEKLRTWEDERDIAKRPLIQLVRSTPEQLAELWAQGLMPYDRRGWDARTEAAVKFTRENEL